MEGKPNEALPHFYQCDAMCRELDKEGASGFIGNGEPEDRHGVRIPGEAGAGRRAVQEGTRDEGLQRSEAQATEFLQSHIGKEVRSR